MSDIRTPSTNLSQSERGMVAIMTTMVLIIVISLIVMGFAQLARRNQRETLDRQLSTQAFYAAETGVNDTLNIIRNAINNNQTIPEKNTCTGTAGGFYSNVADVDTTANVKYSCLLVDPTPKELRYNDIDTTSVIVPVISANSAGISRINLTWQSKLTSGNPLTGCYNTRNTNLPSSAGWTCGYGVLRFDLVPTAGNISVTGLANSTMTSFVVPVSANGVTQIPYGASAANANVKTWSSCTATSCTLSITGLSANSYHMRISSQYRNAALRLTAQDSSNNILELANAQAQIDVTGRAQDVLRRLQVSVPLRASSENQLNDYAIQSSDSICKRYSVMDGYFESDVTGIAGPISRLCLP